MFKKIKDNPYIQKFKEMHANPKLRPIISLVLWLIFMAALIIFIRNLSNNNYEYSDEQRSTVISNYDFTYTNNVGVIFGSCYDDKLEFYIGQSKYYYDGQNVYKIQNQNIILLSTFNLNVLKINPKMIDNLISDLTYTENNEYKQYVVPLYRFINLYEDDVDVDLSLANQYNIIINVYEKNNKIYMYQLDLSSYYNFRNLNNEGILTIDIYDTNVGDFSKFYNRLMEGIK